MREVPLIFTDVKGLVEVFLAGAIVSVPIILGLIAWQRRRSLGQQIYEDAPTSHAVKQGTPTMGGVAFVVAAVIGLFMGALDWQRQLPLILLVFCAAAIGFADDYLKLTRQRALGLRARAKFGLLLVAAIAFAIWGHAGQPIYDQEWFGGPVHVPVWLWTLLAVAAIVGAANAVNLTDGLDGLAAGSSIPTLLFLSWASFNGTFFNMVPTAVAGSCAGFLFFNRHPARIFMGDTGSLALGALMGGLAVQNYLLLLLPIIGLVFVAEALSVMLQVVSFQMTGKRIFKMTPLHHHFELSGWKESQVTLAFTTASWIAAIVVTAVLLIPSDVMGTSLLHAE